MLVCADAQDHPVIIPIPGFTLEDREFEDFSAYGFTFRKGGRKTEKSVEGKYWFLYYEYQKDDRKFSELEIIRNYKQAALEKRGEILSEDDAKLDFKVSTSGGGTIWVHLPTWVDSYELYIIEEEGFDKQLTLGAEEMDRALQAHGRVAIYGIYFDFDKAELKPESDPTLAEIAKLMSGNSELKLYVVGHTDAVGEFDYNMRLSKLRAEAVVNALSSKHGISIERLHAAGVGPLAPVASNSTEDGQAENRRVELVRQ